MAELNDLNITDNSNTARFPEGMAPSIVNDSARALEGRLARGIKDAVEGDKDSTGSSNTYAVAANRTIAAYYDGMRIGFHANHANSGASTLNVDGVGAKAMVTGTSTALTANQILQHQYVDVVFSASGDNFQMLTPFSGATGEDPVLMAIALG